MNRYLLFLLFIELSGLFTGCRKKDDARALLQGEWLEYNKKEADLAKKGIGQSRLTRGKSEAFKILNDSIEFYNGIYVPDRKNYPGIPNHHFKRYCGNFTAYHLSGDSIITRNCETKKWEFFARIKKLTKDSLILVRPHEARLFLRPDPAIRSNEAIDQIVLSFGAWNTAYELSLQRNGQVYYADCMPVEGICRNVYTTKLTPLETAHLFSKFSQKDNIRTWQGGDLLLDRTGTTVTFIKGNKITGTWNDQDESAPNRFYWAYTALQNLRSAKKFTPLPADKPARFIFSDLWFQESNSQQLRLKDSEMHYLWTELYKAPEVKTSFQPTFRLVSAWGIYGAPAFNSKTNRWQNFTFDSVTTDGRLYRFYKTGKPPFTIDLGYNFIKRNFPDATFR